MLFKVKTVLPPADNAPSDMRHVLLEAADGGKMTLTLSAENAAKFSEGHEVRIQMPYEPPPVARPSTRRLIDSL